MDEVMSLTAERDALLRMNGNLTEECEQKHRLIEGLKADRNSRDEEIDALKMQLDDELDYQSSLEGATN